ESRHDGGNAGQCGRFRAGGKRPAASENVGRYGTRAGTAGRSVLSHAGAADEGAGIGDFAGPDRHRWANSGLARVERPHDSVLGGPGSSEAMAVQTVSAEWPAGRNRSQDHCEFHHFDLLRIASGGLPCPEITNSLPFSWSSVCPFWGVPYCRATALLILISRQEDATWPSQFRAVISRMAAIFRKNSPVTVPMFRRSFPGPTLRPAHRALHCVLTIRTHLPGPVRIG